MKTLKVISIVLLPLVLLLITALLYLGTGYFYSLDDQMVDAAKIRMSQLSAALEEYKADSGHYPTTAQGLPALFEIPVNQPVPDNYRQGGTAPDIGWIRGGHSYHYHRDTKDGDDTYILYSYGADNKPGGVGYDADKRYRATMVNSGRTKDE